MATLYIKQSKEALVNLFEQRVIYPAGKTKELLIRGLMEQNFELRLMELKQGISTA